MPETYANFRFRMEICSPVAADSPFDSDTLWGRVLCALALGSEAEQRLAESWLAEMTKLDGHREGDWLPPLLVSEGFQCDAQGQPWLPFPLSVSLMLQRQASKSHDTRWPSRKELKKIERVPFDIFVQLCEGKQIAPATWLDFKEQAPVSSPILQAHLAMDRISGTGLEGLFYMTALRVYSAAPPKKREQSAEVPPKKEGQRSKKPHPAEIIFFLKLRHSEDPDLMRATLERVCQEGWGHAKSRGVGRVRFQSFEPWQPPGFMGQPNGFVSLSHFCPAADDPTDGLWKIQAKHPVPAQFVEGRRVALGEQEDWRVQSFLRLRAGSCFRLPREQALRPCYGRILEGLLSPAQDSDGKSLPGLFHYALAYPWPLMMPSEV